MKIKLNNIIFEELSLSSAVHEETRNVWEEIINILPNITTEYLESYDGVKYGFYSTKLRIFNEKITLNINLYNFLNAKSLEDNKDKIAYLGGSSVYNRILKFINLTIPRVSGTLYMKEAVYENLQHEIEHIFQGIHGTNNVIVSDNDYYNAKSKLNISDKEVADIALIIYLSNETEQDAFVNGLYAYLEAQEISSPKIKWETIKNSDAYIHYNTITNILNKLQNPDEELTTKCRRAFNKTPQQIYKIGNNVQKRFINKIGKIITKYYKDINAKYNIFEYFSGKIKLPIDYFI